MMLMPERLQELYNQLVDSALLIVQIGYDVELSSFYLSISLTDDDASVSLYVALSKREYVTYHHVIGDRHEHLADVLEYYSFDDAENIFYKDLKAVNEF